MFLPSLVRIGSICALLTATVMGSYGDNLEVFWDCKEMCEYRRQCNPDTWAETESNYFKNHEFSNTPFLLEKLFLWDCVSDCDHQCQQIITQIRKSQNQEIYQFYGKWPFKRLFTFQELYSSLFSLGNFFPHYYGLQRLNKAIRLNKENPAAVHLRNYKFVAMAGMAAWTASTIFHWRDTSLTEKLDYFFAGMTVLMGFHAIFGRIMRLDCYKRIPNIAFYAVLTIFSLHILRLYIDWSYTYNMQFNVCFGLLQYILLVTLAYKNYKTLSKKPASTRSAQIFKLCIVPVLLVVSTSLAMSLELFDFFLYDWQIDAHAIWHFCTIWPSWYMYDFFLNDFQLLADKGNID